MSDINTIPPLSSATIIVDPKTGKPTANYILWFASLLAAVRASINTLSSQVANLTAIQAALVAAQAAATAASASAAQAQATADAGTGGGGATSGQSQGTINVGAAWSTAALVSLSGVVAGNLTISGSGPQQTTTTAISHVTTVNGAWRIVEVIGGVDTVVFTGAFTASRTQETESGITYEFVFLYNDTDTSTTSVARTTTGAMDYRLDLQGQAGFTISNVLGYLYVRRAP